MHEQIRILEQEIARLREIDDRVPANLARGADVVRIDYFAGEEQNPKDTGTVEVTWNDIFLRVGPLCMNLPTELDVRLRMSKWLAEVTQLKANITGLTFQRVKTQFYALGLIRMELLMRRTGLGWVSVNSTDPPPQPALCWVLTEAGRLALADLLAAKRSESPAANLV